MGFSCFEVRNGQCCLLCNETQKVSSRSGCLFGDHEDLLWKMCNAKECTELEMIFRSLNPLFGKCAMQKNALSLN